MRWAGFHGNGVAGSGGSYGARRIQAAALVGLVCVGLCGFPRSAWARRYKIARFVEKQDRHIYVEFTFRKFFADKRVHSRLSSAITRVIFLEARVYRAKGRRHLKTVRQSVKVTRDLLNNNYRIRIDDPSGVRHFRYNTLRATIRQIARVSLSLGPAKQYPVGMRFYVDVQILFAPMPKGFIKKVRKWLLHPAGQSPGLLRGGSPLGGQVSIILNSRVMGALKQLSFRTQQAWNPGP